MAEQSSVTSSSVGEKQSTNPTTSILDATPVTITNQKLNGNNFLPWSRAVELFITGRGKKEYLSEKMAIPTKTDEKYVIWEAENSMIMSWLLGSMTPEVSNTFMLHETAASIWNATKEMYSQKDNLSELYELEAQLKDIKQGDQAVSKYFSTLSQIWQQIDSLEDYQWTCKQDNQLFRSIKDTRRIFGFLSGLHKDYDAVRGRVLSTKPLPSINAVFSEVRQEESRMKVVMGSSSINSSETSALVSHTTEKDKGALFTSKKSGPGGYVKKYCKFCQKNGHTLEECYRRPGSTVKPPASFYRQNNNSRQGSSGRSDSSGSWRSDVDSWRPPRAAAAEMETRVGVQRTCLYTITAGCSTESFGKSAGSDSSSRYWIHF